jgi:hypothetical protein
MRHLFRPPPSGYSTATSTQEVQHQQQRKEKVQRGTNRKQFFSHLASITITGDRTALDLYLALRLLVVTCLLRATPAAT